MHGAKILITGPTGQVATPVTLALAAGNDVWGTARFSDPAARAELEAAGVTCVPLDLRSGDFSSLPTDFDYLINLAVAKSGRWDIDLAANAEAVGLLMAHCRSARAVLHCSSTAVYDPPDDVPRAENAALGDNHKVFFPTYSISKIAGEVVARTAARQFNLPTTIARLNVPYGDNGGWPAYQLDSMLAGQPVAVYPGGPSRYNPIHSDDIVAQVPKLLEIASVPATILNWAGPDTVSIQEWCSYMGTLVGCDPSFVETDRTLAGVPVDVTRMHELIGPARVHWRDGLRRLVEARTAARGTA
jgi:nucleoside-diphosphate-sugar epimerase